MRSTIHTEVIVIGSGAGGATTAYELATAGFEVLVLEEGRRYQLSDYGRDAADSMQRLYRNRGMTPILGSIPIGFVEGCCMGGSTEVNSGLWYRLPGETATRWKEQYDLNDFGIEELNPHFEWAEKQLSVTFRTLPWPQNSVLFKKGSDVMGWQAKEIPRAANNCVDTNRCSSGCPKGAKQGMSLTLIPAAECAGAQFISSCKVKTLLRQGRKVCGVLAEITDEDSATRMVRIFSKYVFLCAGATQTPAILRRSGIKDHIGDTFKIHLMLKVAALFDQEINAQDNVMPFIHVQEFQPAMSLVGSYFTVGHLAVVLNENWDDNHILMRKYRHMSMYNVTVRGTGIGSVRISALESSRTTLRYELSDLDIRNLSQGLARLSLLLLAAGAKEIYPCISGFPKITSMHEAMKWSEELIPQSNLRLTTVHAFASCPMGELQGYCAVDSFGKVFNLDNLYINDASMLPDAPSVNPQGTVMAIARRNTRRFIQQQLA